MSISPALQVTEVQNGYREKGTAYGVSLLHVPAALPEHHALIRISVLSAFMIIVDGVFRWMYSIWKEKHVLRVRPAQQVW